MSLETVDAGAPAPANEGAIATAVTTTDTGDNGKSSEPNIPNGWPKSDDTAIDAELMKVWEKNNPLRAIDGKFEAKDPAAPETAAAPEKTTDQPETAKVEQAKPAEPATPAIDPPLSWSADMKAKWAALPPELQTYVSQRDKEVHNAFTQAGQRLKEYENYAKSYEQFDQLIQANKNEFARRGVAPAQAFAVLLEAQRQLDANPLAGLVQIGLGYGIDLRPVLQGQQPNLQQTAPDPRVNQLEAEARELRAWRDTQERKEAQREMAKKQATIRDGETIVEKFQNEKDQQGNPLWPYFNNPKVQDYICLLVQNGEIAEMPDSYEKLKAAYDQAVHALPDIRQRIQEDQRKADEAKRTAEAEARAKEARKSNSVNVRGAANAGASPKSEDEILNEIAIKHYGRGRAA